MTDEAVRVTVVMPVRDEAEAIAASLGSVLAQRYPTHLLEVLVVDGGSCDGTPDRVRALAAASAAAGPSPEVRVLHNPAGIVPSSMNLAIAAAAGDVVVRVDGHCQIDPDYVATCVRLLEETGADNVGGIQAAEGEGAVAASIAAAVSSPFGVGGARFHYATEPAWVDTVYLGAYRRSVLVALGGFDEELVRNQDDELNLRLRQRGGRVRLDPSLRTRYASRSSYRRLFRQYHEYGLWKVRVMQKRATVPSARSLVPAAWVVGTGVVLGVAAATRRPALGLAVVAPYLAGNAAATMITARNHPDARPAQLSAAFATVHAGYGTGFVAGLWRWRGRWRDRATRGLLATSATAGPLR